MSTPDAGALPPTKPSALSETDARPTLQNASLETFIHVLGHNAGNEDFRDELMHEAAKRLRALAAATEEKDAYDRGYKAAVLHAENKTGIGFNAAEVWKKRAEAAESKLTELERENRELREEIAGLKGLDIQNERIIADLKEDKARLDWLDNHDIRKAIDAARPDAARNGGAT